jgi:hypothetical protein
MQACRKRKALTKNPSSPAISRSVRQREKSISAVITPATMPRSNLLAIQSGAVLPADGDQLPVKVVDDRS